jgi:hypothetical protein
VEPDDRASSEELAPLTDDDLLLAPPTGRQPLVVDPRPHLLPFHELTPDDFEKLLLKVAREVDGLRELHKYGVPGQTQYGLDVVGVDAARRPHGYQAKRYAEFTERDLANAVEDYTQGRRPIKVVRLVIGIATVAERTQVIDELVAQQDRNPDLQIELYDQRRLSELLRDRPDIVRIFFGDLVAERFCLPSEPQAAPVATSPLDTVALADAVMRGPVEATGMADVLAEADRRRTDQPEEAVAGYARVEQALEQGRFAGHAVLIRRRRAAALQAAGRLDEAAELLADLTWVYLDRGDVGEARVVLHELSEIVGPEGPDRDESVAERAGAVAPKTRLLEQALDASVTLLQDPIDRMESLGTVVDQLVAERHPYAGRVAVLFAETALAAEQTTEIASRVTAFHQLATDLAEGSTDDKALSVRLQLCLADVESQWESVLDAARRRKLPNDQTALVLARYARDRAWKADPQAAEDHWREAVERGCLARLNEDAADWLYAQRDLHVRYGPIDETLEEPHHLAQALLAVGSEKRLVEQRRDPRELGLDRMQRGQLPEAADALRRYLRVSVVAGRWTNELDAHQLLADLFARAGEPDLAVQHLIRAGAAKQARGIAASVGEHYLDVTDQLDRPAPWERAVAYQIIAEQGDLVPDAQASTIVGRAFADIDAVVDGHARDATFFGPRVYESAHQAIAALADRSSEDQAQQILDHLAPLVPRGLNQYRHTDDAHVDALVGVAMAHPTLRQAALNQLLDLLAQGDSVSERVLQRARQLFDEDQETVLPRLRELATSGSAYAARALGLLGYYDDDQRQRGRQALDRWAAPRQRQPGTVSYGTSAIQDSILVRALPAVDRAAFAARMLALAEDPEEPGFNRREFVGGAINVVSDLNEPDRAVLFEQAMRLARGEFTPSRVDQDLPFSNHPLNRFRYSLDTGAQRPDGLELAARLAQTPQDAEAVQAVAVELLRHGDANSIQQVAGALSWLPREQLSLDRRLLATHPHHGLRTLAAIRWAQDPASDPELGLALARDPDLRVRRMLAKAIREEHATLPEMDPVREILENDPRRSVRRSLPAG